MGFEFEVWSWETVSGNREGYVVKYQGENWDEALKVMKRLKRFGAEQIKFYWR